jgi:integrase
MKVLKPVSFAPEDILDPSALAAQLKNSQHPFIRRLYARFSAAAQAALETAGTGDPTALAQLLASEFSVLAASGESLHDPALLDGIALRKSTKWLIAKNPQGAELERLNRHLIQDAFPGELIHESCEFVEVQKAKGIEFRIYKEIRKLKTMWSQSFRITYQSAAGPGSAMAQNLEAARADLGRLADRVLAGKPVTTRKGSKERDEQAGQYREILAEVAKLGPQDAKGVLEWIREAVSAQFKLGARPLLDFVIYALTVLAKPVTRTALTACGEQYMAFYLARTDVELKTRRRQAAVVKRFCAAISRQVWQRRQHLAPATPAELLIDEIQTNDIQAWLNGLKLDWLTRRSRLDTVRAFFAYSRDALHALPPDRKTAAHLVPRPKPASNVQPVPAPVLSFINVWRILVNLQDLESVWFFALAVFAGLHQSEIGRLVWEHDIVWKDGWPIQVFIASGKGKDKHGNRLGVHVDLLPPLRQILKLGEGRKGKIVARKYLRQAKLTPLARSLQIAWAGSIMRHTFASNLFGLGCSFEEVARQMRNTVTVLKRHYYAPIAKPDAQRFFSLPLAIERFAALPLRRHFWNWKVLNEFRVEPDGTVRIDTVTIAPAAKPRRPLARIAWPDDLTLQVLLWEKSRNRIQRELGCGGSALPHRIRQRGLIAPPRDHFRHLSQNLPVEIPPAVLAAREALATRKFLGNPAVNPNEKAA